MSETSPIVIIAGQIPPPTGGQNFMIERILEELKSDSRWRTAHWIFRFTTSFSTVRKARFSKLVEVVRVICRGICLRRRHGRADLLLYPSGGPQTVPVVRDILLLPFAKWLSRSVWVQFHAAGVAERLRAKNGVLESLLCRAYRGIRGAVVMTDFNRCDPEALGISRVEVLPHRLRDENPEGLIGREDKTTALREFRILYAGHLYELKGTPQLLDAFAAVAQKFPQARLVLMGEFLPPWSETAFRSHCAELGITEKVEWLGVLNGIAKHEQFCKANLFVFPTIAPYESFGLVLAEAMMWGLPIVATDWRGNRDVAGPDVLYVTVDGMLSQNLAVCLKEALANPARLMAMSIASRKRYETFFRLSSGAGDYRAWVERELNL